MKQKHFLYIVFALLTALLYAATLRGAPGMISTAQIESELNTPGHAFETSQERSRYAMVLSLFEDHTFWIDKYASMGTPDVGKINGHYYSLFPPATSIIALPFYALGLKIGAPQMLTFLVPTLFAIATMLVIIAFARTISLTKTEAVFAAVAFGFATNAWGYSVTLNAHLLSAWCIITGLYLTLYTEIPGWKAVVTVWSLYAVALFIDFPNLFIFLPIVILLTIKQMRFIKIGTGYRLSVRLITFVAPLIFAGALLLYGFYNFTYFSSPVRLSNALPRVRDITDAEKARPEKATDPVNALSTRNMLNGFYSFTVSTDRGILIYTPIAVLFVFALGFLQSKRRVIEVGLVTVAATCLTLYCMFGDPYGGWAFGSRYMIAVMPELCLLAAIGLHRFRKSFMIKLLYSIVFLYSSALSLLAAITTNVIPPNVEAKSLGLDAWFIVNIRMLVNNELNSFVYNQLLQKSIPAIVYFAILLSLISAFGFFLIWKEPPKT